jgi:hypothetical protein
MDAALDARLSNPLAYFLARLHEKRPAQGWLRRRRVPRVTRILAMELAADGIETIPSVDASVVVRCSRGSLWITHDGDCKDLVLGEGDFYRAQRRAPMRIHALGDAVVEIQFDDLAEPQR